MSDSQPRLSEPVKRSGAFHVDKSNHLANAMAGASSGALISAVVQPLDVLRTRMQAEAARGLYRSTLQTATSVVSEFGVRGLWQGTVASVLRLGSGCGLHFMLLEKFKLMMGEERSDGTLHLSHMQAALAGGLSRSAAAILSCPFTVIKTRMEYSSLQAVRYRSVPDAVATIMRTEGPVGLFRGLWPTVCANAPFSALYYMFYRQIKKTLNQWDVGPAPLVTFTASATGAVAATLMTQPFDVVRTRMQLGTAGTMVGGTALQSAAAAVQGAVPGAVQGMSAARQLGTLAVLMQVFREGPRSLMAGVLPRVLKRTSQTALVWTLYEELVPRMMALAFQAGVLPPALVASDSATASPVPALQTPP